MLRTVHGPLIAIIVTVLCSGICGLNIYQKDAVAVTDKFPYNNLDLESLQLVEPLIAYENDVEVIPEDDNGTILRKVEENQNENEDFQKDTIFRESDDVVKQRVTRQATHQYSSLYPQLPSGPPYNPYQPQPNNNPSGQNPYQQQPGYNPYGQNSNQQQPIYNPYGQNPNQQQPSYNPFTQNPNQQQPTYNPYGQNPNQQQPNAGFPNPNQGSYNPSSSQNPYNSRPNFPSYNNTFPGNSYRPPNGQYPLHNQTFNSPYNSGSFRLPSASGSNFTTPYTPYNAQPGQPPYNNYNSYPVHQINSTSQRPPYYNPSQYSPYNNSRPNPAQWQNPTNSQYPNSPGARPAQGTQGSSYFPGPDGKFPSNSYNPSIPNYPPQNNNQGQNNFFYPQNNNSASYDPRTVPSQNFSYH